MGDLVDQLLAAGKHVLCVSEGGAGGRGILGE